MPMLLIDLVGASAQVMGLLGRRLVEVRPGMYVGAASQRSIEIMWDMVVESSPQAGLLVYPSRTELGISLRTTGQHRYAITDNYGLQLISVGAFKEKS